MEQSATPFAPAFAPRVVADEALAMQTEPVMEQATGSTPNKFKAFWLKWRKVIIPVGVVLALLVVATGVAAYQAYSVAQVVKADMQEARFIASEAYASFKAQDLVKTKEHVTRLQEKVGSAQAHYQQLSWAGAIPFVRNYYNDGEHGFNAALAGGNVAQKVIAVVEPHADVLGFTGEGTFAGGTTEDRVGLLLQTLGQLRPALDDIAVEMDVVEREIAQINPEDYPEEFRGTPVRSYLEKAHELTAAADLALSEARPVIEQLPAIAGAEGGRRKYLVLFQNDNELRPTGGFLTAYAVVFVENGKVTPEKSDDIYPLDQKFRNKPPIPPQLGRYLITESKWNLRDMNIDPNFKKSMETFYANYSQVPGEPKDIDGIIAIDTNVLEKIVNILGPIDVPGYGVFSTEKIARCDCPQIIYALSEIIDRPTPYIRENRKGILAPMMQSLIQKTYATSRDKWPLLAEEAWKSIEGRHVQFYFFKPEFQEAAESVNAAGIIPQPTNDGSDFLTVVDANLAGAKSNLFVETQAKVKVVSVENGKLTKEVELTYRNTHPASNCNLEAGELCLNGRLNNWSRWYVPKGAEVVEALGFKEPAKIVSEEGYDVIEGVFSLEPNNQAKVRITYTVPYTYEEGYKILLQKQGGTDAIPYNFVTPWGETDVILNKDQTVRVF